MAGFLEEVVLQQSLKAGRGKKREGTAGGSESSNGPLIIGST